MSKVEKQDTTAELWATLGKISADTEQTKARLAQLNQKYMEVYQSIQATQEKPATEPS